MMKKIAITQLLFVVLLVQYSYAEDVYVYKYMNDDNSYTTILSSESEYKTNQSFDNAIMKRMINAKFDIASIPNKYYNVITTNNVVVFGNKVTQYEIQPIKNNRFPRVLWVDQYGKILKSEIYSNLGTLVVAFNYVSMSNSKKERAADTYARVSEGADEHFYSGYYHNNTKIMPDGSLHLGFSDGVNRFSVFVNPFAKKTQKTEKVLYGNNLYSKSVDKVEYTVLGSLPHQEMKAIVDIFSNNKGLIIDEINDGKYITESLYNKMQITFDGGTP